MVTARWISKALIGRMIQCALCPHRALLECCIVAVAVKTAGLSGAGRFPFESKHDHTPFRTEEGMQTAQLQWAGDLRELVPDELRVHRADERPLFVDHLLIEAGQQPDCEFLFVKLRLHAGILQMLVQGIELVHRFRPE
ncbi:hypothetical protein LTI14_05415 [Nesterenkonia sp. YGD6]|nr:hypothetical protein [Nesterenkonia sp. YGD6]